jgi:hypothetical protein
MGSVYTSRPIFVLVSGRVMQCHVSGHDVGRSQGPCPSSGIISHRAPNGSGTTMWKVGEVGEVKYPAPFRAKHSSQIIWLKLGLWAANVNLALTSAT